MNIKLILKEFMRYVFIGGSAFCIDLSTLYFFKTRVFSEEGNSGIYISTALGFLVGLVFNYIFSLIFVFESAKEKKKGRNISSFCLFLVIGIIGLILTEVGMRIGIDFLNMNYLIAKIVVATLVLIWNYVARKVFIFT